MNFGESESEDSDSDCEHCSHHTPKDFVASRDGAEKQTVEENGVGGGGGAAPKDSMKKADDNPIEATNR